MKAIVHFLIIILSGLFLTACPSNAFNNAPKNPDKIVIRWRKDGGMLPDYQDIYISKDSAHWKRFHFNADTKVSWKPSKKEVDELYNKLLKYNFDKIKSSSKGEVYDRGGISITIDVDGKTYNLDDSGNSFINDNDAKDFSMVSWEIEKYSSEKVISQMLSIPLIVSENIYSSEYEIRLELNDKVIYGLESNKYNDEKDDEFFKLEDKNIEVYPSDNRFKATLYYPDSLGRYDNKVIYKQNQTVINVDSSVTQFKFKLQDDKVPFIEKAD